MNSSASLLQAFLFSEGASVSRKRLLQLMNITAENLEAAAGELGSHLATSGLVLLKTDTEMTLAMKSDVGTVVAESQGKELDRDIGEAGLEVLSIILYRGPSTRAQIDFIRGVNTSTTIRNLLARGLLERAGNPADGREYLYRPTVDLLAHLGVLSVKDLPEYATISSELANFEQQQKSSHGDATNSMHNGESL